MSQAKELSPIQQVRALLAAAPIAEENQSPQKMRENMETITANFPIPEEATIRETTLGNVRGEWTEMPATDKNRVILYFHGGGYVIGSPKTHRPLITKLAASAGVRIFAPDYRMGPENPFPAAVEDAAAVYKALMEEEGFKPENIAVSGDSAGGGLTMALLLKLRDDGAPLPKCAAPISPWVDLTGESKTMDSHASRDPMVQRDGLLQMAGWYLGGADAKNPLASPLFADLKTLPPLLIQVGSEETLLDDSRNLHKNAEAASVDAKLEVWDEMIHVWHAFHFMLPEGARALEGIAAFFKKHWGMA